MVDLYPGIGFWDFAVAVPESADVPVWADNLCALLERSRSSIDSRMVRLRRDDVLAKLRPGLEELGYDVETPGHRVNFLPGVHAGYRVDAWHPDANVVLEVEAVRAQLGGAFYRDIFRLLVSGADRHGVIAVPLRGWRETKPFDHCFRQMALLAAGKPQLPFRSLLLLGY